MSYSDELFYSLVTLQNLETLWIYAMVLTENNTMAISANVTEPCPKLNQMYSCTQVRVFHGLARLLSGLKSLKLILSDPSDTFLFTMSKYTNLSELKVRLRGKTYYPHKGFCHLRETALTCVT